MTYVSKNAYLTDDEMRVNALYIYGALTAHGWTRNAVAAILANMQVESTINPGIYESLNAGSTSNGFGLVQWTPNTKFKTWADANGYAGDYGNMDAQIARILWELENGIQWIETDSYPLTFADFTQSTGDVGTLAYAFMYNYERPASLDQPQRKVYAGMWLTFLGGTKPPTVDPDPDEPGTPTQGKTHRLSKLLLYSNVLR